MAQPEFVLKKLDQIEQEMRRIGCWSDTMDEAAVRENAIRMAKEEGRSPVGMMPFETWLQAVFIPNARDAARSGKLPASSHVSVMGMREYDYQAYVPEAQGLLQLLREFDALFT